MAEDGCAGLAFDMRLNAHVEPLRNVTKYTQQALAIEVNTFSARLLRARGLTSYGCLTAICQRIHFFYHVVDSLHGTKILRLKFPTRQFMQFCGHVDRVYAIDIQVVI